MSIKERIVIFDASHFESILKSDNSDDLCTLILNFSIDSSEATNYEICENDNIYDFACKYIVFCDSNLPKSLQHKPTLLHLCAFYGACECLQLLVSASTSIFAISDVADDRGKTVAHFAAINGKIELFHLLEEDGFNLNQKDIKGRTPIYSAVKHNNISIVKYLFINRNANKSIKNENENSVEKNLNNIDDDDNDEMLAQKLLHTAAVSNCSISIVKFLIEFAETIKLFDQNGVSLFSKVIDNKNIEFLSILLNSFDQCIDSTGLFPIHHAAAIANNVEIIKILIEFGADIECRSISCSRKNVKQGETPLITACKHGAFDGVLALLEFDADFNAVDENGRTAFHYAAKNDRVDIAELLLDFGADPSVYDSFFMMPADIAYERKKAKMIKFFKEMKIEPQNNDNLEVMALRRHKKNEKTTMSNNSKNLYYI